MAFTGDTLAPTRHQGNSKSARAFSQIAQQNLLLLMAVPSAAVSLCVCVLKQKCWEKQSVK